MASSTEPIWIRAILWSFLLNTEGCVSLVSREDCLQFTTTIKDNSTEADLLKELEGLDCGS